MEQIGFMDFVGYVLSLIHGLFEITLFDVSNVSGIEIVPVTIGSVIVVGIILPVIFMLFLPAIRKS